MVHGKLNAAQRETLYHLGGHVQPFGQGSLVLGRQVAEHIVDLSAAGEVVADAEAQTCVLLGAEHLCDMAQSVVARLAAAGFHAERAEGKSEVINDHEESFQLYLLFVHPVAHGVATEVHIGGRLEEEERLVLHAHFADEAIALVLKGYIGCGGHCVQHAKANVVARPSILGPYVAQAYDEMVHGICFWFERGAGYAPQPMEEREHIGFGEPQ